MRIEKFDSLDQDSRNRELVRLAYEGQKKAYAPYSGFDTGAALLTEEGEIFLGCNVENAAYGPTNCAERTAIFKAVSEGYRRFRQIAVVGNPHGKEGDFCPPCGVCRQVMEEFCDPDSFEIILGKGEEYRVYLLRELLPAGFGPKDLA